MRHGLHKVGLPLLNHKRFLGLITARGGSKRLPGKNLALLGGKPLIAWTVIEARKSKYLDRVVITSEDQSIIDVAKEHGAEAPFTRPMALAQDKTSSFDVALHALEALGENFDYLVLLQPTSPLRTSSDIDGCIEFALNNGAASVTSVAPVDKSPLWMYFLSAEGRLEPIIGKEDEGKLDFSTACIANGAVYVEEVEWFLKNKTFVNAETLGYLMPDVRSVDIDTAEDLEYCAWLIESGKTEA